MVEPSRSAFIYRRIREAILAGKLPPGTPLSRRALADQYSVSTLPVADALQRLEAEAFVESRPRAGTRVRIPRPEEIRGHYLVREALEVQASRLFAESATGKDRKDLLVAADHLDQAFAALESKPGQHRQHAKVEKRHFAFHMQIAKATGCRELVEAIERSRVLLMNWLFMTSGEFVGLPARWHGTLAEAIASKDIERADAAMRKHVQFRRQEVEDRFAEILTHHAANGRIVRGPQKRNSNS